MKRLLHYTAKYILIIWLAFVGAVFGLGFAMLYWPLWAENLLSGVLWILFIFAILAFIGLAIDKKDEAHPTIGLMIIIYGVTFFLSIAYLGFVAMGAPDKFAESHPIPEGMDYYLPIPEGESPLVEENDTTTWLQVWEDIQGGIYKYDYYANKLPAGVVYLKCFEAGKNVPLSEDESRRAISNITAVPHSEIKKFEGVVQHKEFTIYEGDWEHYYAARIEVWHRDSLTNKEYKLNEKIYRVEGWMR